MKNTEFFLLVAEHNRAKDGLKIRFELQQLITKNPNLVNAKDEQGNTALHLAAKAGNNALVQLLIRNSANPNLQDKDGNTALHLAAMQNDYIIVDTLLKNNSDPNIPNHNGKLPININPTIDDYIKIILSDAKTQNVYVKDHVHARDNHGNTALHYAVQNGNTEMVAKLLDSGADINAQNHDGDTAYHLAARNINNELINLLQDRGANTLILNKQQQFNTAVLANKEISEAVNKKYQNLLSNNKPESGDIIKRAGKKMGQYLGRKTDNDLAKELKDLHDKVAIEYVGKVTRWSAPPLIRKVWSSVKTRD